MSVLSSCGKDELTPGQETGPADAPVVDSPEEWHDKIRTLPYPKMSNELYINPSPLIVPQGMKTGKWLQFALSDDSSFPDGRTVYSDTLGWNMFNPHTALAEGTWYWKFRNVSEDGTKQEWSETIPFEVKGSAPVFVTPDFSAFRENLPREHPRLYCWLRPYLENAKANVSRHEEYGRLLSRAQTALDADCQALLSAVSEDSMEMLSSYVEYLYQAAILTDGEEYLEKMDEILGQMLSRGFSDSELFLTNFCSTYIAYSHLAIYDLLYDRLPQSERSATEELLMRYCSRYFASYCGS